MSAIASAFFLLLSQASAAPSTPVLQVGVFVYGPDGKPQAAAYETSLASESFQYVAGCEVGGGNRPAPDRATDAWRVSGSVERASGDEAVVRVDWQRVRAAGTSVTSPGGSVQLTLHAGDRVLLDSANPNPGVGCGPRTIGFEARFAPRPGWMVVPGRGALQESPAVTIMRGGGISTGSGSGTGAGTGSGVRIGGTSGNTAESPEFTADLWLVRRDAGATAADADFNMQGVILEKVRGSASFAFTPFTIDTPGGPLRVAITGVVQVTTDRGPKELVFSTARKVQYANRDHTQDSTSSTTGSSTTRNPMPGPDDVLSFVLPPLRVPNSGATVADQYSVRVRVR